MARQSARRAAPVGAKKPLARTSATEPAVAEVTDAPTTSDPDGNEAVVEIDGEATQPNSDGTDGGVQAADTPTDLTAGTDTPDAAENPAAGESGAENAARTSVDPNPNDTLTDEDILTSRYRTYWQGRLDQSGVQPPEGRLLFPGEPLTFSGHKVSGDTVIISEDVFRVVFPFRSLNPTFTLEARAGKRVPRAKAVTKAEYLRTTNALASEY